MGTIIPAQHWLLLNLPWAGPIAHGITEIEAGNAALHFFLNVYF